MTSVDFTSPMPSSKVRLCSVALKKNNHLTLIIGTIVGDTWENITEGSLVVDVGGGVGKQSLTLATHQPHLRFVFQDQESVIGDAIEVHASDPPTPPSIPFPTRYSFGRRTCPRRLDPVV